MTQKFVADEAIKYGKEQLEIFGGTHADFIKLAIQLLEQDNNKKLLEIKQIIEERDEDSMPEDYFYIDKIREVINK